MKCVKQIKHLTGMCLKHSFFVPSKKKAFPNFEVLIYFGTSQGQNFMVEVTDDSQHSLASSLQLPFRDVVTNKMRCELVAQVTHSDTGLSIVEYLRCEGS
jgi:hypothetical protein